MDPAQYSNVDYLLIRGGRVDRDISGFSLEKQQGTWRLYRKK
jgi:hypothetical protein